MNTTELRSVYPDMKRPVTVLLVLANLLAYLTEQAGGVEATCQAHGLVPAHFTIGAALDSLFLHVSWTHLLGNLAVLGLAGALVEPELGSFRFLVLYLAAGVAGAVLHTLVDPAATDALVGASGAIFGLLPIVVALRPRLVGFVAALAAVNVWYALFGGGGEVSFGCHLGGLAVGVLFAFAARAAGTLEAT